MTDNVLCWGNSEIKAKQMMILGAGNYEENLRQGKTMRM